jgi:hypothetical protein
MSIDQQNFNEKAIWKRYINGKLNSTNEVGNFLQSWSDVRNGSSLPNWRKIIQVGGNASTGYTCVFRRFLPAAVNVYGFARGIADNGVLEDYLSGRPDLGWGVVGNPGLFSESQADIRARSKFIQHYRERRTAFQGGVFLGEMHELVKMIKSPAQALRQAVDRHRGALKERLQRKKYDRRLIQDSWLEFVFGVSPFISDCEDALRLATADPIKVYQKITGTGLDEQVCEKVIQQLGSGIAVFKCTSEIVGQVRIKYKGVVSAENTPPSFPEQCGLSWSNVLPTVWELIPYSFLIDYFSNVGKVIDGISTGSINLAWGCKMTWKTMEQEISNLFYDRQRAVANFGLSLKDFNGYASGGSKVGSRSEYVRARVDQVSLGIGDLQFKLPGSGTKWLNIAALVDYRGLDNKWLRALP